jgi:micrococcal nuclease
MGTMHNFSFIAFLRYVFFLQALFTPFISHALSSISYTVLNCHDGDTCRVRSPDNITLKIRLIGIDAPEVSNKKNKDNQLYGKESKEYINNLIKGKSVTLKNYATDQYGRNLSEIFLDKENINLNMVTMGMAEVYKGKSDKNLDVEIYHDAEKKAKKNKIGIWSLSNYQSPKDYRSSHKK